MFSSIYAYVFMLFVYSTILFKSDSFFWKSLALTGIILFSILIFQKLIPEIHIHINKGED